MRRRFMTARANRSYLARSRSKDVSCGLWSVPGLRSIQTDSTGTKVLESRYDATIEKPTARASGANRLCAAPVMKKAGMNTARIQSMATNRGSVVSAVASLAARARLRPSARRVWMFSMVTVASSTRMPTANANPPKVMMLIVWPDTQTAVTAARIASGMFKDHDERTAPVPQKQQHHKAREHRAESTFDEQALDGARHVGGLVELVTDLNIVR